MTDFIPYLIPFVCLLLGLIIGGVCIWLVMRAKVQHAYDRAKGDSEAERATLTERVRSRDQALENERRQSQEKLALLDEAEKKLSNAFKALAAESLQSNNQSFLDLAKTNLEKFQETAKGDLDKRQQAINEL